MSLVHLRAVAPTTVLMIAAAGVFMEFVDSTIVNIAVPSIGRSFPGAGLSEVSWTLNAYSIVFASFLVAGGRLADRDIVEARLLADLVIVPDDRGVGMLEFHQYDAMLDSGREAAREALRAGLARDVLSVGPRLAP